MSNDVCNDLLADIFQRLPSKSVIRLRSLSKYWHSRLATAEFVRDYSLRWSKNPQKVLIKHKIYCGNNEFKDIFTLHPLHQLPLDPESGYINNNIPGVEFLDGVNEVVGSCNGIICLSVKKNYISLWNLSIRRELIVPRHPFLELSLKFPTYGFGFDPITDDYKIVAIFYSPQKLDVNNAFLYSLKTDSWSVIPSPSSWFYNVKAKACLFNGILHWVVDGYLTEPSKAEWKDTRRFILTFDLSSRVFGYILLRKRWRIRQLTTINGCLAAVTWECGIPWELEGGNGWILKMKEYGKPESWSVLYKLEIKAFDVIKVFKPPITDGELVACYEGSKVCIPETGLLTKLMKFGPDCFNIEMEAYADSLELLHKQRAITSGETILSWSKEDNCKRIRLSQVSDDDDDDECSVLNYTF